MKNTHHVWEQQKMLMVRPPEVPASDRDHGTFKEQNQFKIHFSVSTSWLPVRKLVLHHFLK